MIYEKTAKNLRYPVFLLHPVHNSLIVANHNAG